MAKSRPAKRDDNTPAMPAPRASRAERHAAGKAQRERVPREQHGEWKAARSRPDPVDLVLAAGKGRVQELLPIRHARMAVSPFTFFRGAALHMAADLADTSRTDIRAQLCGDCHLMNFGGFATPERRTVFDINDFDETLPGPWEWDLKRLTASFVLAARSNGFGTADQQDAATACARAYRRWIARYAEMAALSVWYAGIDMDTVLARASDAESAARLRRRLAKAAAGTGQEGLFPTMVKRSGSGFVIKDDPPLVYHDQSINLEAEHDNLIGAFVAYRETLADDRRVLLDRYRIVDFAVKVVGVGSVGTFCGIFLLMDDDDQPLFLQVKEARASVLEGYLGKSSYPNHAQRVVIGQRLMQSASDIFLGWTAGQRKRHFYCRQLRDMKIKFLVEIFNPATMRDFAALCGRTLARAHARSGDAAAIAGYLGKSDVFDRAVARFAQAYANQAERDHAAFVEGIRQGRIEVRTEG
jgi:uncharacterized protein (DUF2252 family)